MELSFSQKDRFMENCKNLAKDLPPMDRFDFVRQAEVLCNPDVSETIEDLRDIIEELRNDINSLEDQLSDQEFENSKLSDRLQCLEEQIPDKK